MQGRCGALRPLPQAMSRQARRPTLHRTAAAGPARLPKLTTWYLVTNLARPNRRRRARPAFAPADLAEVVRLYGLRNWVEQGYKQVKGELGWADFQVRSDRAIRRHWTLVCCAFSFCWRAWFASTRRNRYRRTPSPPRRARGGSRPGGTAGRRGTVAWPQALRRVRGWLGPWVVLERCWRAWSTRPPPAQLGRLLDAVAAGRPLHLYLSP